MISTKIILAVALIMTVGSASLAMGKQLTIATPQDVSAKQLVDVAAPTASVGQVTWIEGADGSGNIIVDTATVPVTNSDSGSHDYRVCAILKGTDNSLSTLTCTNLSSVAASATGNASLDFSSDNFSVQKLDVISVSVKETA